MPENKDVQILPTPPVGWPIVWYKSDMDDSDPISATVTAIEGPGRVSIYYVALNGFLSHKRGVNWIGDDRRLQPGRPFKVNGCWDFLPDLKPRNSTKYHRDMLARKEAQRRKQEEAQERMRQEALRAHEDRKKQAEAT